MSCTSQGCAVCGQLGHWSSEYKAGRECSHGWIILPQIKLSKGWLDVCFECKKELKEAVKK